MSTLPEPVDPQSEKLEVNRPDPAAAGDQGPAVPEKRPALPRQCNTLAEVFALYLPQAKRDLGARTYESNVRFEQRCVVLEEHKTAHATGKPRLIPLVLTVLKLLVWMRARKQASVVGLLERLLKTGPKKGIEVARFLSHYGASDRAAYRARLALGVIREWVETTPSAAPMPAGPELDELVRRINAAKGTRKALEAGRLLLELKKHFELGQWLEWFSVHFTFSDRLAQKYMQAAKSGRPSQDVSEWSLKKTLQHAAESPANGDAASKPEVRLHGYYTYRLPEGYKPAVNPDEQDFVFMTCLGNALNKSNLGCYVRRVRPRAGVPVGVSLYHLRHRFGFMGIKNGVALKLLSLCMGHANTVMTEKYINAGGLSDEVQQAAIQVAYGPGAFAAEPPPPPRAVPTIAPPPVESMPFATEHLPSRYGMPRTRPEVPAGMPEVPVDGEQSVDAMLRILMSKVSAQKKKVTPLPRSSKTALRSTDEAVYQAVAWAVQRNPELAKAKDSDVFAWLQEQPDCPCKLPPTFVTFSRYLSAARLFHDTRKRVTRGRPAIPPTKKEGAA